MGKGGEAGYRCVESLSWLPGLAEKLKAKDGLHLGGGSPGQLPTVARSDVMAATDQRERMMAGTGQWGDCGSFCP